MAPPKRRYPPFPCRNKPWKSSSRTRRRSRTSCWAIPASSAPFQIGLQTKREQTDQALALVRDTLRKFVKDGPTAKELKAARDNLVGGFADRQSTRLNSTHTSTS